MGGPEVEWSTTEDAVLGNGIVTIPGLTGKEVQRRVISWPVAEVNRLVG